MRRLRVLTLSLLLGGVLIFSGTISTGAATTEPATTQIAATQIATTIPSDELLENTVVDGFNMSDDEARSLEKTVHENPVDIVGRAKLLGYYFTRPFNSAESQAARRGLALWMIAHLPDQNIAGKPYCWFDPVGDSDGYAQGKDLWLAQVAKMPQSAPVLANAGRYFQMTDPKQAQDFFQKAIAADPTNPVWPADLADLYVEALHRAPDSERAALAGQALTNYELAMNLSTDPKDKFNVLTNLPNVAVSAGNLEKAKEYADQLLADAKDFKGSANYGNAIYDGYEAQGRIYLAQNHIDAAKQSLLDSASTPGSARLGSAGPDLTLARDLLAKGEGQTVVKFLALCGKFWHLNQGRLSNWIDAINAGQTPDFGANVRY